MREAEPDLFVHSGDLIYADAPIPETIPLDDGTTWRNLVADGVDQVAETLEQFRGRYRYNFRDVQHKVSSLNSFEDRLRKARLSEGKASKVALSISG